MMRHENVGRVVQPDWRVVLQQNLGLASSFVVVAFAAVMLLGDAKPPERNDYRVLGHRESDVTQARGYGPEIE